MEMRVGETLVCFEALYCNLLALSSDGVCSLCHVGHQLDMEISVQLSLQMKDMLNACIFIFGTLYFRNLCIQDPLYSTSVSILYSGLYNS